MTTGIEELKPEKKRKGRGPGKKPALFCTSIRIPKEVLAYFDQFPNKQVKIREVLTAYVTNQTQGENHEETVQE